MKTCLLAERLCPYCDVDVFTLADARIVTHGRQGFQKGCRCEVCEAWHMRDLNLMRRRVRALTINNRGAINVLRNGL